MHSEKKSGTTQSSVLALEILGIGNVPSFKNSKQISVNSKTGKRFPRTHPKKKEWMERAIRLLESQLRGELRIRESGMLGECQKPSLIALLKQCGQHFDDSIHWMIPGEQSVVFVPHGEEGCVITIEEI